MLPIRYDAATGKLFLTVRAMGEDLLYLNTLATGTGTTSPLLDRGQTGESRVVRFDRRGARVLLIQRNSDMRAISDNAALRRSAQESFPESVLAAFAVQSESASGVVVDATDFFLSDVYDVAGQVRGAQAGNVRVDRERSFVDASHTRAFERNTEVRAVLSYVPEQASVSVRVPGPDARSFTVAQHHSILRLPERPYAIRQFDPRAGLIANNFFDFAQGLTSDYRRRGVVRWRMEPSDTAAYLRGEKVTPVRPIVYYLDPGIPEPYRSAYVQGGMWWNEVLGAAGWKDAFRIEPLPEGVDPMDARYPMIYLVHRIQRGPSVGPGHFDPRTGEIIGTVVRMDSYRSLVDHDIYMGLVPAAGGAPRLQMTPEAFGMARRRQHVAHEIGHTLGLQHNFVASTQGRASVMDYPYPLIRLAADGGLDMSEAYRRSGGAHDTLAIRYAYTWFPTPEAEAAGLRRIVREAESAGLRFVADDHAGLSGSYPGATLWVEGADMLSALEHTMSVRRRLIDRFDERAAQPGEPLAVLNRRFAHVYLHHRYALHGAIKYVGGMEFGYAMAGEATSPTRVVPPEDQRRALQLVLSALQPEALRIPERVIRLVPPVPPGYDADLTLIPTAAGTAFDPMTAASSLANEVVAGLLHPERAARVVSFNARNSRSPSLDQVLSLLVGSTWGHTAGAADGTEAALRAVAQRAVLDGILDLAGSPQATAQVRASAEHQLTLLKARLDHGSGALDRALSGTAKRDIERYFAGRDDRAARPRPAPIPLPWP